ncbi:hypothetical protein J1N35_025209 [Gossypium stocksii]|uniref:Uncharacterized protein n=1 Tax=Gossypium stocksii TaxID=47602 RepID=A0A9D3V664_9ROSI|nr:hypothetical protein J1N35_025209 [Gossypium stocksii]
MDILVCPSRLEGKNQAFLRAYWIAQQAESIAGQSGYCPMVLRRSLSSPSSKDLRIFNIALLGRQVWCLINCRDTCFKVLSAKYFLDGDVFHPKNMDKPSYTWQSIAKAAATLNEVFS